MTKSNWPIRADRGAQEDADDYADNEFRHALSSRPDRLDYSAGAERLVLSPVVSDQLQGM